MKKENYNYPFENWFKALESYGTPKDFYKSTQIFLLESEDKEKIPIRRAFIENYFERENLIKKLIENRKERLEKSQSFQWENDSSDCFLCDNVGQAKDIGSNIILPWDMYENNVILPNRYPLFKNHLLCCSKNHNGYHNSNTINKDLLDCIIDVSIKYDLIASRNHPLAGMSIKNHEHFHLIPRIYKHDDNNHSEFFLNGLSNQKFEKFDNHEEFYYISNSEFATLAVSAKYPESLIKIIDRFDYENKIFTLVYDPFPTENCEIGNFFISPHKKQAKNDRSISSMTQLYIYTSDSHIELSYFEVINRIKEYIYRKENFSWEKYF